MTTPSFSTYTYTDADILKLSNQVKEIVVADLCKHGYLTSEEHDRYLKDHILIGYKYSWLGKMWRLLNNIKGEDQLQIRSIYIKYD